MTLDEIKELADEVEQVLMDTVGTQMLPGQVWNLSKPLDALLPLFKQVAADAAAEALSDAGDLWDGKGVGQVRALRISMGTHSGAEVAHWLRARAAELRATARTTRDVPGRSRSRRWRVPGLRNRKGT